MRFRSFVSVAISVSLLAGCATSVEIQETAVAPPSTANATETPSNYFKYRFNGNVLERKGNLDLDWSSESFYPLDSQSVAAKSFAAIKASSSKDQAPQVHFLIGENVPASMKSAYLIQIEQAIDYYDFSGMSEPIDILIYTEKDKDLMQSYWKQHHSGEETIKRKLFDLSGYEEDPIGRSVGGGADLRQKFDGSFPRVGIDFAMSSAHTQEEHLLVEHVAHEMAHVWQWHVSGMAERAYKAERFDIADYVPCHAMEGGAGTLGIAVAVDYDDWYLEASDVVIRRVARDYKILSIDEADAVEMLMRSEDWDTCGEGYAIGLLAFEWMVAEYGAEAFFGIFRNANRRVAFEDSIKQFTGLSKQEFYESAASHIVERLNKALQKS